MSLAEASSYTHSKKGPRQVQMDYNKDILTQSVKKVLKAIYANMTEEEKLRVQHVLKSQTMTLDDAMVVFGSIRDFDKLKKAAFNDIDIAQFKLKDFNNTSSINNQQFPTAEILIALTFLNQKRLFNTLKQNIPTLKAIADISVKYQELKLITLLRSGAKDYLAIERIVQEHSNELLILVAETRNVLYLLDSDPSLAEDKKEMEAMLDDLDVIVNRVYETYQYPWLRWELWKPSKTSIIVKYIAPRLNLFLDFGDKMKKKSEAILLKLSEEVFFEEAHQGQ